MAFSTNVSDAHFDEILTNISFGGALGDINFMADRVFPVFQSNKRSNEFGVFDRREDRKFNEDLVTQKVPRSTPNYIEVSHGTDSFTTQMYHLGFQMEEQVEAEEDEWINSRNRKAQRLNYLLKLDRDARFKGDFLKTGIWSKDIVGGLAADVGTSADFTKWDLVGSTPQEDFLEWKEDFRASNYGLLPNRVTIPRAIAVALAKNDQYIAWARNWQIEAGATFAIEMAPDEQKLAAFLDIASVIIVDHIYNAAEEGIIGESTPTQLFDNTMLLVHTAAEVGRDTNTAGTIFAYNALGEMYNGIAMQTYNDDALARQGVSLEVHGSLSDAAKIVNKDLGYYVTDVIG